MRKTTKCIGEMKEINDYSKVFETLVQKTSDYVVSNGLKAMILGISGGIDSTVCAAICHEVSKKTGIPLIGRSLPTKFNKEGETTAADLVGKAFCDNYDVVRIEGMYLYILSGIERYEKTKQTKLANGNIQARLRMIYLYNLASLHRGLVIDTDNLTENNLGYFTRNGDTGDFNPIGCLWKTEVFELARWLYSHYLNDMYVKEHQQAEAIAQSLQLKPTAGLGITDSDLDEIGAESYEQVDSILQEILAWKWFSLEKRGDTYESIKDMRDAFLEEQAMYCYPIDVIIKVTDRHFNSEFKRKHLPIKITRDEI